MAKRPSSSVRPAAPLRHTSCTSRRNVSPFGFSLQSRRYIAPRGSQWAPSQKPHIWKPVTAGWLNTIVRKSRV